MTAHYYEAVAELPPDHCLHLQLPPEIPAGPVRVAIIYERVADAVDVSPLVITALETLDIHFQKPLELLPTRDEDSHQYLCVAEPSLGLYAYALNRELLVAEVQEQLRMLWREYALADDAELDAEARQIKAQWLARVEVANAQA